MNLLLVFSADNKIEKQLLHTPYYRPAYILNKKVSPDMHLSSKSEH